MNLPTPPTKENLPLILFVCVQNAGRSQMAAAFAEELGRGRVLVRSGGTAPADEVHPIVAQVMNEIGIDLTKRTPRMFRDEDVREADAVITMGCGDACPIYPGKRYEDWDLEDPSKLSVEEVRQVRDEIRDRVEVLLSDLPGIHIPD